MLYGDIQMAMAEGSLVVSWESRAMNRQRKEDCWAESCRDS